jgi:hypothetical protein
MHKGVKKPKKQRNLNTEEHYETENNYYHDYDLQKPKHINPTNLHKQKKTKINNKNKL